MKWPFTKQRQGASSLSPQISLEQAVGSRLVLTRLDDIVNWGRKYSIWPFNFGLSCCYVEMAASLTSRYDIARFGAEVIRGSPREADLMVIAGTVFIKMVPAIKRLYDQMMEPRWVISMGSCANSGGMYDIYSVVQGVDTILPVDVYIPGCPPSPSAFMEGLLLLQQAIAAERRPLSWVTTSDGKTERPDMPSLRDLKKTARRHTTLLPPQDRVDWGEAGERNQDSIRIQESEGKVHALSPCGKGQGERTVTPDQDITQELNAHFGGMLTPQETRDSIPTFWVDRSSVKEVLRYLKTGIEEPFRMLYDLTAIDERLRKHRDSQPESVFTLVYHLLSYGRNADVRIKVPLRDEMPMAESVTDIWPSANWYEREAWDMFGITFNRHPDLRRILLPPTWKGHALRKDHPARATEMEPFEFSDEKAVREEEREKFRPEEWGMTGKCDGEDRDCMFLNMGPNHPSTHGLLRVILELDGEEIRDVAMDIGYHHRGAEKMGERQTWHTYIPYTDRVDYLGGVMNNFPYVLAVEQLVGITIPERAQVIRIMLAELYRIASHLVYYGTFAQDVGAMSPVFFMFNDRERIFRFMEAVCGGRMHQGWFRIGGVAQDLPKGWDRMVGEFLAWMPRRLNEYDKLVLNNGIFKARTRCIGTLSRDEAVEWGMTGPNLRACGMDWDFRKKRPYSGYDWFDFNVPVAPDGDCWSRVYIRVEEMRQSLRIIGQCLKNMPEGPYKSDHPLTTPPRKERTMHDIETLINHFLGVSWGPVIPAGEGSFGIESTKGNTTYYLVSDGGTMSYRTRIRTPSFAHIQMVPLMSRGLMVADLVAILGSIDYVLADVDR